MSHQYIPNFAWVPDNRCVPFTKASVRVDGLRPFVKIESFHLVLLIILAFCFQYQHVAVFHADQEIRPVFSNNATIDIEYFESQMIVLDPCCNLV